jgi:hypothetical protein
MRNMPLDIPQSPCELQGVPHVTGGLSADASGLPVLLVPPLPPAPPLLPEPPEAVAPPELVAPPVTVVPPVRVVPPAPVVPASPVAPPVCVDAVVAVTPPLSVTPPLPPLPAAAASLPDPAAPPPLAGPSNPGACASGLCWPMAVPWLPQPAANPPATIAVTRHPSLALVIGFLPGSGFRDSYTARTEGSLCSRRPEQAGIRSRRDRCTRRAGPHNQGPAPDRRSRG